jgi:glycosyltransferase involved in cell wall biosynthesis
VIGLYCPDVPPVPGGVSDHTLILAQSLNAFGHPPVVLARRGDPARFAPMTCVTGLGPTDVAQAARAHGVHTVVIQYVPFLFARRGVSPALVLGVRRMVAAGLRIAVIIHEPFVPFTRLPWLVTGFPQRWQFGYLVRSASHVYTPLPRFADVAHRYTGSGTTVVVAPIGATLPVSQVSRDEARHALGLTDGMIAIGVFSPAASGFAHDWIAAAAARLALRADVTWVRFGFGSDRSLRGYPTGANVVTIAETDAETVGRVMRALDLAAAPYVDGLTMRRSSAMLALAHGVPTVSSTGHLFDPQLREMADCEPTPEAFATRLERLVQDAEERRELALRSHRYHAIASVDILAGRLLMDLMPEAMR